MALNTLKTIRRFYNEIKPDLAKVEEILQESLRSDYRYIDGLLEHLTQFAGKRIRPALLLFSAHATGKIDDIHRKLAATVEMLHNATLVHDDVLDEALLRRKVDTINRVWDNERAIIFGDLIFARTFNLVASLENIEAYKAMTEAAHQVCTGELLQLSKKYKADLAEPEYLEIIDLKTASLFETSCRLGTLGSNVTEETRSSLGTYGRNLGVAFQIVDDTLDVIGEENIMGKSLGTDITKGKVTLPVLRMMAALPQKDSREVAEMFAQENHDEEKRDEIRRRVRETEVLPGCINTAREYIWSAKKALQGLPEDSTKAALTEIADFVIERVN